MWSREGRFPGRWTVTAYACVCASLALVVGIGIWGIYRDLHLVRTTFLRAEIGRLRAQAVRRAGHMESGLEKHGADLDWYQVRKDEWMQRYWSGVTPLGPQTLYAAIVDPAGIVVIHSNPNLEDGQMGSQWYDRVVQEAGPNVVETHGAVLSDGQAAYDIGVPIMIGGKLVGTYHEGLDANWVDEQTGISRRQITQRWMIVFGGILIAFLMSTVSLFYLGLNKARLRQAMKLVELRRITELGQLAGGLAHEIRNPLHAIRLNLHAFARVHEKRGNLSYEEVAAMLQESNREIDRVDRLMQQLLGFAKPEEPKIVKINVNAELSGALSLIKQELVRNQVEVKTNFPQRPAYVRMDAGRLRQIMLNLFVNAQDELDQGGRIDVGVRRVGGTVEIAVADNGHGVAEENRERIFEPFFSTKQNGTGFGLAMVKRFVDEAEGTVRCESDGVRGTTFRILLPAYSDSRKSWSNS